MKKQTASTERLSSIEAQIEQEQKAVSYDIREFTVEYYVNKYSHGVETDENELYVPDYQREFIWDEKRQSKFVESLLLGLPIPLVFVAEIEEDGRLEIVDGSQRIRTLAAYLNDELILKGLEKLKQLNGLSFSQLQTSRQRKFKNLSMRMIVLSSKATEDIRNEMFDRINTSSVPLLPMETRRGIYRGKFTNFIAELAKNDLFKKLCPVIHYFEGRREEEELILRFFAFSEAFPDFKMYGMNLDRDGVASFLDNYLEEKNKTVTDEEMKSKTEDFTNMLNFINKTFPKRGFAKKINTSGISKPYFEAIAIGAHFAIKVKSNLSVKNIDWALVDKNHPNDFQRMLYGRYHTHKPNKIRERIEYVKTQLLANQ
ncbi:DUF262 domain-containing protein [Dysgonomonas mossii]|uniref:DUF262 domain-containing protein n=1 Tax=Dysgonomonas mossii TaxID=163665 RepID=UPI003993135B